MEGTGGRRRIGEVLVSQGVLSQQQLESLLADQMDPSRPVRPRLGRLVAERGLATERQIAAALATAMGLPLTDLSSVTIDPTAARTLPRALAERSGVMVLRREGGVVDLAVSDPTNVVALDDVRLHTGARELRLHVVGETQLADHLARAWSLAEDAGEVLPLLDAIDENDTRITNLADIEAATETAPVVKLVDVIIGDALGQRASDVHVEPQLNDTRVRFRVDGLLRDVLTVPRGAHAALVSRLKILASLDIAERRRPQDGRAKIGVGGRQVDVRMSTLPSLHGEKVVMRLLPKAADVQAVDALGLDPRQVSELRAAAEAPQGLVLLTGPTGSGKTSTLYAMLRELNRPERNIVTLEDPVEISLPGITQVQVNTGAGLTFARGLRSVLRQDPDLVLVGEVRDSETAELALQASLTGHLVLTTLHTNDAVAALTRLVDMGIPAFLVASSLTLVAAQRLVRRPCEQCSRPTQPAARTLSALGLTAEDLTLAGATPMAGSGCSACAGSGYRGRLAVYEVMPVTAAMRAVLLATPTEAALAAAAKASGISSLRDSAVAAAHRGETTYEEVLRVTADSGGHSAPPVARRCTSCDHILSDAVGEDAVCCPWCGSDMGHASCPHCHRPTAPGWRRCPHCREQLADVTRHGLPRVLAVDADPVVGSFVRSALSDIAEVDVARTAEEALRLLETGAHQLVIADVALPDITGDEFIRLLRTHPTTTHLPVLVLTGSADEELLASTRRLGAQTLRKPIGADVLVAEVQRLLAVGISVYAQ